MNKITFRRSSPERSMRNVSLIDFRLPRGSHEINNSRPAPSVARTKKGRARERKRERRRRKTRKKREKKRKKGNWILREKTAPFFRARAFAPHSRPRFSRSLTHKN
ncbi:hypothetical protein PUN28_015359 [Cardiocondyla obscurior]|uniref:Uncharacterized protein n=1 Tax=Cardiocondyla obscurior TaxID=286306 RepID=A0AAW2ESK7_9HYME